MGNIIPLELDLDSSPGRYGPDGGGQIINGYPEYAGEKGKLKYPLYPIEGMLPFATLSGGGRTRGMLELNGYAYTVSGVAVFKVDPDGNATNIGTFGGSNPVFMARNRKASTPQIALVCDGLRYLIESDSVGSIADSDLPAAVSVDEIEGYFVWAIADGRYFISAIDEGTTIDALDFLEASGQADSLQVAKTRGREIVLLGTKSIEFHSHTGAAEFPFEPNPGTFIRNLGCMCRHSVKDINDVPIFVASDGTVRRLNGYTPERISSHAVERSIEAVTDKDTITATVYQRAGHQFYSLSAPTFTWTWDGLTNLWQPRRSIGLDRWKAETSVSLENKNIVGSYVSGLLYELSPNAYDEAGGHLVWTVILAPVHAYPAGVGIDRLFVDIIPGTGLNSTDAHESDPQLMVQVSRDSGKTWSNERTAATGAQGQFSKRVVFDQLGQSDEDGFLVKLSMSAPVIRGLTGVAAEVEPVDP